MPFTFYHLFSSYAKYAERYFSSVTEDSCDYTELTDSLHQVLIKALSTYADDVKHKQATYAEFNGKQIEGFVRVLAAAYHEAHEDAQLNSEIRSCFYPNYFMSLLPDLVEEKRLRFQEYINFCCPAIEH